MKNNQIYGCLWKQFLALVQPYWYPVRAGKKPFLGLLLLVVIFAIAVFFVAVGAAVVCSQHYFPEIFSTITPNLAESVTKIINSPAIYLIRLSLLVPLIGFFYYWQHLQYHWRQWVQLVLLLLFLLATSGMNVVSSYVGRDLITAIAQKDPPKYFHMLFLYGSVFAITTPLLVFSNYFRKKLALSWQRWLTNHFLNKYFHNRAYYKINSHPDIDNPDLRIAHDIEAFSQNSINLFFVILHQLIDVIAFCGILWSISKSLVAVMVAYSIFGNLFMMWMGRELISLNFQQLRCEGDFRYGLIHIRNNAESIAFYRGEDREASLVKLRFNKLIQNYNRMIGEQRNLEMFTTGYNYFLLILPYLAVAPKYLSGKIELGAIIQASIACNQLVGALSVIVSQFETVSAFAAVISRLATFEEALEEPTVKVPESPTIDMVVSNHLALENVALQTPNYEQILVKDLSVSVKTGERLLIVGDSGCGKSSLLRALAGLWNAGTGAIARPNLEEMLFLPQRPYMILGSLREQLLYPNSSHEITDNELDRVLQQVNLQDLLARVGGFDAELDWKDVLSLGEQQRLAFARLLLARPRVAILDEATSALDLKNEEHLYRQLQQTEITFISVGHRESLLKYHHLVLELLGDTKWRLHHLKTT